MHKYLKSRRIGELCWRNIHSVDYSTYIIGSVNGAYGSREKALSRRDLNKYVSNNTKNKYKRDHYEFLIY